MMLVYPIHGIMRNGPVELGGGMQSSSGLDRHLCLDLSREPEAKRQAVDHGVPLRHEVA
jgi:hypothetical protein